MSQDRQYDIILFGATGYTGNLTAQYLAENAPTNVRWAIAGRSESKLQTVAKQLNEKYTDRTPVDTFVADLKPESLKSMAEAARLVITTVGPYCRYGEPLVEACAKAGTHYVDCTGEHIWVLDMINKYHSIAQQTGAIIVPQCAFESAPADMSSFALARFIRRNFNTGVRSVTFSLHDMMLGISGGTIETFLSVIDVYPFKRLAQSQSPLALSPLQTRSWNPPSSGLLPVKYDRHLGYLAPWIQAVPDRAIVMRSWGLHKQQQQQQQQQQQSNNEDGSNTNYNYGDDFTFEERKRVPGRLAGLGLWLSIAVLSVAVVFPPIRWIARKIVTQPGFGPSEEDRNKGRCEWRSIGETDDGKGRRAMCTMRYAKGEAYMLTGLLIAEAGLSILYDNDDGQRLASKLGGGVLTPACLGERYIDRLNKAGVTVDVKEVE